MVFIKHRDVKVEFSVRFFFFQAEDGIRDLVRSRGLGDVYKRQDIPFIHFQFQIQVRGASDHRDGALRCGEFARLDTQVVDNTIDEAASVSYTHLTLPTSDLV